MVDCEGIANFINAMEFKIKMTLHFFNSFLWPLGYWYIDSQGLVLWWILR